MIRSRCWNPALEENPSTKPTNTLRLSPGATIRAIPSLPESSKAPSRTCAPFPSQLKIPPFPTSTMHANQLFFAQIRMFNVTIRSGSRTRITPSTTFLVEKKGALADKFVPLLRSGSVYQAFLRTADYHRWHCPIEGEVIHSVFEGTYYAVPPDDGTPPFNHPKFVPGDPQGALIRCQPS